jgi:hypothetical protein
VTDHQSAGDRRSRELFVETTGETTLRERHHDDFGTMRSPDVSAAAVDGDRLVPGLGFDDGPDDAIGSSEREF